MHLSFNLSPYYLYVLFVVVSKILLSFLKYVLLFTDLVVHGYVRKMLLVEERGSERAKPGPISVISTLALLLLFNYAWVYSEPDPNQPGVVGQRLNRP